MRDRNLAEILPRHARQIGSHVAVRFKRSGQYRDLTWAEYNDAARACAAALVEAGIVLGDRVGLLGENRVEWLLADMGILTAGAVTVTPHSSLSARQIHYQMQDAGVRWLFVSTAAQLEKVSKVRGELPGLKGIVAFDSVAADAGVVSWDEFLARGRQSLDRLAPELTRRAAAIGPDDLATIMYTSGTTGDPKGVMLTHENLLSNVASCLESEPPRPDDVRLCWLPLSHIFARTCDHYERLLSGHSLCLAESAETVIPNIAETQPTHISCVPRFYEKVLAVVASTDPKITAAKLRAIFGPRIRFLGAGGAPLPVAIEQTLRDAGLPVFPGYGLTESSPVISFNTTSRSRACTVGPALSGVEIKIAPDGEILARGPNIMKGYWNKPEATAETIRDGWLYTGDLGSLDADGFLSITGRKKEMLVLSNGKKVIPTQVEGLLIADECIDQAVVFGEGRSYLTALIVPHWDNLRKALGSARPGDETEATLARQPDVNELMRKRISACLADLAGYEQVKRFIVLPSQFTVAAEELTVSLKMRRGIIFKKYQVELDALYRE